MTRFQKLISFLLSVLSAAAVFVPASAPAHQPQEGLLHLSVGPYLYQTYVPPHYNTHIPMGLGFGLLVEGDVDKNGGIEMGLFYMRKAYFQALEDGPLVERVRRVHIPFGYRHWWSQRFSTGLSFYSSYSMGDPEPYLGSRKNGTSAAHRATKYGLDVSLLWDLAIWEDYTLIVDARLSLDFGSRGGEHSRHYGVLSGLKIKL